MNICLILSTCLVHIDRNDGLPCLTRLPRPFGLCEFGSVFSLTAGVTLDTLRYGIDMPFSRTGLLTDFVKVSRVVFFDSDLLTEMTIHLPTETGCIIQ